jgi:hypothetical protein
VLATKLVEAADEKILAKTIVHYGRVDLLCIDDNGAPSECGQSRRIAPTDTTSHLPGHTGELDIADRSGRGRHAVPLPGRDAPCLVFS